MFGLHVLRGLDYQSAAFFDHAKKVFRGLNQPMSTPHEQSNQQVRIQSFIYDLVVLLPCFRSIITFLGKLVLTGRHDIVPQNLNRKNKILSPSF